MASAGGRPPCGEWGNHAVWLSEDAQLRTLAVRWCQPCPLLDLCDAAATEDREAFGVWGGRDRTPCGRRAGR